MKPEIHRNALKHLSREEVISAWANVVRCIQHISDDEPPPLALRGVAPRWTKRRTDCSRNDTRMAHHPCKQPDTAKIRKGNTGDGEENKMSSYIAANGQEITDALIDQWCEAYEQGEFPEGEHTVGGVVMGRPPLSMEKTVAFTIKMPVGMKAAIAKKAKENGKTASGYARDLIAEDLMAAG